MRRSTRLGSVELLEVAGADAARFLQGQLVADLGPLDLGASCWSLLLEPDGRSASCSGSWSPDRGRFVLLGAARPRRGRSLSAWSASASRRCRRRGLAAAVAQAPARVGASRRARTLARRHRRGPGARGVDAQTTEAPGCLEAWALAARRLGQRRRPSGDEPLRAGRRAGRVGRSRSTRAATRARSWSRSDRRALRRGAPHRLCDLEARAARAWSGSVVDGEERRELSGGRLRSEPGRLPGGPLASPGRLALDGPRLLPRATGSDGSPRAL